MISNEPIDGTCFRIKVFYPGNPYDPTNSEEICITKWGEDIEELINWYNKQEFNYTERIEIVDDSK